MIALAHRPALQDEYLQLEPCLEALNNHVSHQGGVSHDEDFVVVLDDLEREVEDPVARELEVLNQHHAQIKQSKLDVLDALGVLDVSRNGEDVKLADGPEGEWRLLELLRMNRGLLEEPLQPVLNMLNEALHGGFLQRLDEMIDGLDENAGLRESLFMLADLHEFVEDDLLPHSLLCWWSLYFFNN